MRKSTHAGQRAQEQEYVIIAMMAAFLLLALIGIGLNLFWIVIVLCS